MEGFRRDSHIYIVVTLSFLDLFTDFQRQSAHVTVIIISLLLWIKNLVSTLLGSL